MFCWDCPAVATSFDGVELVSYCKLGTSEDKAYHENTDTWSCKRSQKTIEKRLKGIDKQEREYYNKLLGGI